MIVIKFMFAKKREICAVDFIGCQDSRKPFFKKIDFSFKDINDL